MEPEALYSGQRQLRSVRRSISSRGYTALTKTTHAISDTQALLKRRKPALRVPGTWGVATPRYLIPDEPGFPNKHGVVQFSLVALPAAPLYGQALGVGLKTRPHT